MTNASALQSSSRSSPSVVDPPPLRASSPESIVVPPGLACVLLAVMGGAALITLLLTFLLPDIPYIRYQQAANSVMFHSKWIYERINFDPTPIDVAVIGTSRAEAGISPTLLSEELSIRTGKPISVANLSLVRPGRDWTYQVVKMLVEKHPEVRLLALSNEGNELYSHPMFKATADIEEIVDAPVFLNIKYFENILYIPFRNLSYGLQGWFPKLFGVKLNYDPAQYLGANLDRTLGYTAPTGEYVNGDRTATAAELRRQTHQYIERDANGLLRYLRWLPPAATEAVERVYIQKIADLCAAHGVKIAFVILPVFENALDLSRRDFEPRFGSIIRLDDMGSRPEYFADGSHLNRSGAIVATRMLAAELVAALK